MAKMRKLQPRLAALQERHRGDRQKMAMAQMELFKAEKVNPIGGCLPMLLQFPVFIALYWVIFESVELRQAPFMLWIHDLSRQDPYYVLPLLNVVIMWYTQKLTPMAGMDPMQQKIFQFMPIMMGVLFAFFPAGLVLYWCMQSGLSLIQQVYNIRKYAEPTTTKPSLTKS
jgi:YidC/Oxa1 family membrane protein insertase